MKIIHPIKLYKNADVDPIKIKTSIFGNFIFIEFHALLPKYFIPIINTGKQKKIELQDYVICFLLAKTYVKTVE